MKIKKLREIKGLSQAALAEKAGVAQSTIHYIEHGSNATQKVLSKIAYALGVKVSDLLEDDSTCSSSQAG